jgi:hypothetical protein
MDKEKLLNDLYEKALCNHPTFSEEMIEHMKEEIERVKEEAKKDFPDLINNDKCGFN